MATLNTGPGTAGPSGRVPAAAQVAGPSALLGNTPTLSFAAPSVRDKSVYPLRRLKELDVNHIYGNNCGITCGSGEELTGAISWREVVTNEGAVLAILRPFLKISAEAGQCSRDEVTAWKQHCEASIRWAEVDVVDYRYRCKLAVVGSKLGIWLLEHVDAITYVPVARLSPGYPVCFQEYADWQYVLPFGQMLALGGFTTRGMVHEALIRAMQTGTTTHVPAAQILGGHLPDPANPAGNAVWSVPGAATGLGTGTLPAGAAAAAAGQQFVVINPQGASGSQGPALAIGPDGSVFGVAPPGAQPGPAAGTAAPTQPGALQRRGAQAGMRAAQAAEAALPGQAVQAALPGQVVQVVLPGQAVKAALPGQAVQVALPGQAVQAVLPGQAVQAVLPGQAVKAALPGQAVQVALPGQAVQAVLPGQGQGMVHVAGIGPGGMVNIANLAAGGAQQGLNLAALQQQLQQQQQFQQQRQQQPQQQPQVTQVAHRGLQGLGAPAGVAAGIPAGLAAAAAAAAAAPPLQGAMPGPLGGERLSERSSGILAMGALVEQPQPGLLGEGVPAGAQGFVAAGVQGVAAAGAQGLGAAGVQAGRAAAPLAPAPAPAPQPQQSSDSTATGDQGTTLEGPADGGPGAGAGGGQAADSVKLPAGAAQGGPRGAAAGDGNGNGTAGPQQLGLQGPGVPVQAPQLAGAPHSSAQALQFVQAGLQALAGAARPLPGVAGLGQPGGPAAGLPQGILMPTAGGGQGQVLRLAGAGQSGTAVGTAAVAWPPGYRLVAQHVPGQQQGAGGLAVAMAADGQAGALQGLQAVQPMWAVQPPRVVSGSQAAQAVQVQETPGAIKLAGRGGLEPGAGVRASHGRCLVSPRGQQGVDILLAMTGAHGSFAPAAAAAVGAGGGEGLRGHGSWEGMAPPPGGGGGHVAGPGDAAGGMMMLAPGQGSEDQRQQQQQQRRRREGSAAAGSGLREGAGGDGAAGLPLNKRPRNTAARKHGDVRGSRSPSVPSEEGAREEWGAEGEGGASRFPRASSHPSHPLVGRNVQVPVTQWKDWRPGPNERHPPGKGFRGEIIGVSKGIASVHMFSVNRNGRLNSITCTWPVEQVQQWLTPPGDEMTQQQYTRVLFGDSR